MKKLILISIVAFALQSCMSYKTIYTIIPENTANEIPLTANKILIENDNSLSENYQRSYKTLLSQNYRIDNDNKEMGYILASKQDIGDTQVRLNIACEDKSIKITSEWTAGTQTALMMGAMSGLATPSMSWYNAQWNAKSDKSTIAFANAVKFAKELNSELKYETVNPISKAASKHPDPIYN
ncbi:hypothetical protein [Sunxiuqinia elliptica]|uniref:Lipoprotein n=1 Tax=Sunxiuqinia elliptica TaxID=655355 RepID=A0A4R6GX63_9BACT|nr:hypothetical protein [Sunxiuqinia elliptica]TDN99993.1 hypothetical protein DET52_106206 [Sunxiuqinia elliptica]TDO57185.1 hypothetical protein DET65_3770 [Sunxiuqinia elliptica]